RRVRDRFGTLRPLSSASSVSDLGRLSWIRRNRRRLSSESTAASDAREGNQMLGISLLFGGGLSDRRTPTMQRFMVSDPVTCQVTIISLPDNHWNQKNA